MYRFYATNKTVKEITLKLLMKEINFYVERITSSNCIMIMALPEDDEEKDIVLGFGFDEYSCV